MKPKPWSSEETALRDTLRANSRNFDATLRLAHILLNESRLWESSVFAANAAALRPEDARGHDLLGTVVTETSPVSAEEHLRRAFALDRSWPIACRLARCLKRLGRFDEARELYLGTPLLAKPHPNGLWALREWADLSEIAGWLAEAETLWKMILDIDPEVHDPLVRIARLRKRAGWKADVERKLRQATQLTPTGWSDAGMLYDELGQYAKAWHCFERGKAMAREQGAGEYPSEYVAEMFSRLLTFPWGDIEPADTIRNLPQPLFVAGFMRSGTTLAEQILTTHPEIAPGGELRTLPQTLAFASELLGRKEPEDGFLMDAIRDGDMGKLRDFYIDEALRTCRPAPGARWFCDKMPLNEVYAPMIALMFPKSPIIRMVRHPLDVMVSAFSHHATHGHNCCFGIETAALHYARVDDLMFSYWETAARISPLRYEHLVDDPSTAFEAAKIPYGAAIDHTTNTRVPLTPSHEQVREPLYTTSIERWHNYRKQLQPAIEILGPTIERLGYNL